MDDLAAGGYQTAVAFSSLWMDWTKIRCSGVIYRSSKDQMTLRSSALAFS